MPGGKIAVYSGLISSLNVTDDELAAVIGHEISHALREHSREQVSHQMCQQLLIGAGAAILGVGELGQQGAQTLLDVTLNLPHSRTDEVEADRFGVELAARAGYDPRSCRPVAGDKTDGRSPQWLHAPGSSNRMRICRSDGEWFYPFTSRQR
jgi:predicted Zn-dependent protease